MQPLICIMSDLHLQAAWGKGVVQSQNGFGGREVALSVVKSVGW